MLAPMPRAAWALTNMGPLAHADGCDRLGLGYEPSWRGGTARCSRRGSAPERARAGRSGHLELGGRIHPARSSSSTACAPSATWREIRRGEAASPRCRRRAARGRRRRRAPDKLRRTERRSRGAGRRAGAVAFHAWPIAGHGRFSDRSGLRTYMRLRIERCITLHTVRSRGVRPLIATTMAHTRGFDPG
jgi:hypothetical protein